MDGFVTKLRVVLSEILRLSMSAQSLSHSPDTASGILDLEFWEGDGKPEVLVVLAAKSGLRKLRLLMQRT